MSRNRRSKARDAESMRLLADRLARNRSLPAKARALYKAAHAAGDYTAAFNFAASLRNVGDYKQAVIWYGRALERGDKHALLELARAQLYGLGTKRDTASAIAKLRELAEAKLDLIPPNWLQCEAMMVLADIYISGWPVLLDYKRGLRWLKRAAALNYAPAKAQLGHYG